MKYIITESQEADLIFKVIFGKDKEKEGFFSKLLKLKDSDFELGKAILGKAKNEEITDIKEIFASNTAFTYGFKVNGYPFIVKYRYKRLEDSNPKRYSIKSPWISDAEINISDELLSIITDYIYPKGYEIQSTMDVIDGK